MIIRNKHESQEIGVTNKFNEQIFLKPGEQTEVEDAQGKGYLANYSHILEKVDVPKLEDDEKDEKIAHMEKQIGTLTKLVERLAKGEVEGLTDEEKALISNAETSAEDEEKEKAELVAFLKGKVKGVGTNRSLEKLRKAREELSKDEEVSEE